MRRSALVVVDANVLLNLYRYNDLTRDDLLGLLRRVGDRLWIPHQVMREALHQWAETTAVADEVRDGLVREVASLHRELVDAIGSHTRRRPTRRGYRGASRCSTGWKRS